MRIAVTRGPSSRPDAAAPYAAWLERLHPGTTMTNLLDPRSAADMLRDCDGLLLPGGGDIAPHFYGQKDPDHLCTGIDEQRDELEFAAFNIACSYEIPVLGICRGLQLVNAALGGTMIADLPRVGNTGHGKLNGHDASHSIALEPGTLLSSICGVGAGIVNSAHHQAACTPAPALRVSARAADGVIEALEWSDAGKRPFLLCAQWHPERMDDVANPLADHLALAFLRACTDGGASTA